MSSLTGRKMRPTFIAHIINLLGLAILSMNDKEPENALWRAEQAYNDLHKYLSDDMAESIRKRDEVLGNDPR